MKSALIAGIVAAAVAAGSATATTWANGSASAPPPATPSHGAPPAVPPAHPAAPPPAHASRHRSAPPPQSRRPLTMAEIQGMIAAWSAAHPGWKNPADMTHAEMLQAMVDHPAVYAPDLNRTSRALRIFQLYGSYTTLPPKLLAVMRSHGYPIPANLPHVSLGKAPPAGQR